MGLATSGLLRAGIWAGATQALGAMFCAPAVAEPPDLPALFAASELKIGALDHDTPGLWSGFARERQAVDANFEVLFAPWARTFGGYLRPALGATVNFNGDTSKAYADVRWEIESPSGVFFAVGLGAAIHDGNLGTDSPDRKALGARVLFHPSAEIGYRFDGSNSISIFADHVSNGFTRRDNEGMDTIGVRLGHRFGPPMVPEPEDIPVADFSGFYIGAAAGYQLEQGDWIATSIAAAKSSDYFAGAYAGYAWQSGKGVFGFEVDGSPVSGRLGAPCIGSAIACQIDMHGLYSVRSKFGWVVGPALLYGTAGMAVAYWDSSAVVLATGQPVVSMAATNYGVAVGAGLEYKVRQHLGVRAEVLHYGLPGVNLFVPGTGPTSNQFQSTVGRAGIAWYFN